MLERRDGRAGAESDELGRLSHAEAVEELGPGDGSELPVDGALWARLVPLLNPLDVLPHRLRAARQCACGAVAPSLLSRCGERHVHNRTVEAMGADTEPATEAKRIAKTALATRLVGRVEDRRDVVISDG